MRNARNGVPMFSFVLVSKLDRLTLYAGDAEWHTSSAGNKHWRLLYGNLKEQLGNHARVLVLNIASHSEVMQRALRLASSTLRGGPVEVETADIEPSVFLRTLAGQPPAYAAVADSSVASSALDEARGDLRLPLSDPDVASSFCASLMKDSSDCGENVLHFFGLRKMIRN